MSPDRPQGKGVAPPRASPPPREIRQAWGLRVETFLGGRSNLHWQVSSGDRRLVLRRCGNGDLSEVAYELRVLQRLDACGWAVPVPVEEPLVRQGHTWCLFTWLPGVAPEAPDRLADQRARGRLLAELHGDLETLTDLGQRPGWQRAEDVVADTELTSGLRAYERLRPEPARILRWHAERARERFDQLHVHNRPLLVLHGDFNARNLLCQQGNLTGIVDFEATHLNHRASEFALAWSGRRDDVVRGYHDVHPLDDVDRALLAPALWSWALLGVAQLLRRMSNGEIAPPGLEWPVDRVLRRSPLMGEDSAPYPGLSS